MIKLFKYLKNRRKKRINYPKGYQKTNNAQLYTDGMIKHIAKTQKMLKENTGKYYTISECNDLLIIGGEDYESIKRFLVWN